MCGAGLVGYMRSRKGNKGWRLNIRRGLRGASFMYLFEVILHSPFVDGTFFG